MVRPQWRDFGCPAGMLATQQGPDSLGFFSTPDRGFFVADHLAEFGLPLKLQGFLRRLPWGSLVESTIRRDWTLAPYETPISERRVAHMAMSRPDVHADAAELIRATVGNA
jgi:hypothetical protein